MTKVRDRLDAQVAQHNRAEAEALLLDRADKETHASIAAYQAQIDMSDSQSILSFGTRAQREVTQISEQMLSGVRGKAVGPAGEALAAMVRTMRELDLGLIDPNKKPNWLQRSIGRAQHGLSAFQSQYEQISSQIERITHQLDQHKTTMLQDIEKLDRLYGASLDYFHDLEIWIAAGDAKLSELDQQAIPALDAKSQASGDLLDAQQLRDLRQARDELERRVHDLRLTRQVTMQSLPSIRLLQENDKTLVGKINSTLANTVPLWQTQLAQSLTLFNTQKAGLAVKAANDLTNALLTQNAEALREANRTVRSEAERGVVDVEALQRANDSLIHTLQESLQIAQDAKAQRRDAEQQLVAMERSLKSTLRAAQASAASGTDHAVEPTSQAEARAASGKRSPETGGNEGAVG